MSRLLGRPRNRRRRGRDEVRRRLRSAAWVAAWALVAGLVAWVLPPALDRARHHPYFALDDVAVLHRGHVSPEAIRRAAGLHEGMSIWDVDTDLVRRSVDRLPWVRTARVARRLPRRILIRVREFRPSAIVRCAEPDAPLYYVAASGRVFAQVGPDDSRDFPYVSGLSRDRVESGAALYELRLAMQALRAAARHAGALGSISEVALDQHRGLTLMPAGVAMPIALGAGDVERKLARVAEVYPHWVARAADVRSIHGLDDEQVVVRLRRVPKEWGT